VHDDDHNKDNSYDNNYDNNPFLLFDFKLHGEGKKGRAGDSVRVKWRSGGWWLVADGWWLVAAGDDDKGSSGGGGVSIGNVLAEIMVLSLLFTPSHADDIIFLSRYR
jgi:hypothetical protein